MLRTLNHALKDNDNSLQDFKKRFEQWPMCWEQSKELEGHYFEKF
jgi:hypothetical protein